MVRSTVGDSILGAVDFIRGGEDRRLARDEQLQINESRRIANQAARRTLQSAQDMETFQVLLDAGAIYQNDRGGFSATNPTNWNPDLFRDFVQGDSNFFKTGDDPNFRFDRLERGQEKGSWVVMGSSPEGGARPLTEGASSSGDALVRQFSEDNLQNYAQARLQRMLASGAAVNPGTQPLLVTAAMQEQARSGDASNKILEAFQGLGDAQASRDLVQLLSAEDITYENILEMADGLGIDMSDHFNRYPQTPSSSPVVAAGQGSTEGAEVPQVPVEQPGLLGGMQRALVEGGSNPEAGQETILSGLTPRGAARTPANVLLDIYGSALDRAGFDAPQILKDGVRVIAGGPISAAKFGLRFFDGASNQEQEVELTIDEARQAVAEAQAAVDGLTPTTNPRNRVRVEQQLRAAQTVLAEMEAAAPAATTPAASTPTASTPAPVAAGSDAAGFQMEAAIADAREILLGQVMSPEEIAAAEDRASKLGVRNIEDVRRLTNRQDQAAIIAATAAIYAGDPTTQANILDGLTNYARTGSFSFTPAQQAAAGLQRNKNDIASRRLAFEQQKEVDERQDANVAFSQNFITENSKIVQAIQTERPGSDEYRQAMARINERVQLMRAQLVGPRMLSAAQANMDLVGKVIASRASNENDGIFGWFNDFFKPGGSTYLTDFGPERFLVERKNGLPSMIYLLGPNGQETSVEISVSQLERELGQGLLDMWIASIETGREALNLGRNRQG